VGGGENSLAVDRDVRAPALDALVGVSRAMVEVRVRIERLAPTRLAVMIRGERGTGKELVARALHDCSGRSAAPFVVYNAAAFAEHGFESDVFGHIRGAFTGATAPRAGAFREANGGTLFLDEVGDMRIDHQAKLLRVLETGMVRPMGASTEHHVDVRVVAATNTDLEGKVAAGHFRADLLDRLAKLDIVLPPLRLRGRADVAALIKHFAVDSSRFTPEVREWMEHYTWPGNARELQSTIEKLQLLADGPVDLHLLDRELCPHKPIAKASSNIYDESVDECHRVGWHAFIREIVHRAVDKNGGNVRETSRRLRLSRKTITKSLARSGPEVPKGTKRWPRSGP
jgi:DNA-binding NtrC family response regulator